MANTSEEIIALRKALEAAETNGTYYNGELRSGGPGSAGTYWIDKENNKLYEYATNDPDLSSDDLDDIDITCVEEMDLNM